MSYETERLAIEAYIKTTWGNTTPLGFDAQAFTPVNDSVLLTIQSGAVLQGSIGRVENVIHHIGTVTLSIYTEGGKGSAAWRELADTAMGMLFDKRLTEAGALATGADCFVRFSPPQLAPNEHPYIGASFPAPPFHIVNIIAPFVRYETR